MDVKIKAHGFLEIIFNELDWHWMWKERWNVIPAMESSYKENDSPQKERAKHLNYNEVSLDQPKQNKKIIILHAHSLPLQI